MWDSLIPNESTLGDQSDFDLQWNEIIQSFEDDFFNRKTIRRGHHKTISVSSSPITLIFMEFQSHVEIHASKFAFVYVSANTQVTISLRGPVFCYIFGGESIRINIYAKNNTVPAIYGKSFGKNPQITYINDGGNDNKIITLGNTFNFDETIPSHSRTKTIGISKLHSTPYSGLICGYDAAIPDFTEISFFKGRSDKNEIKIIRENPNFYIKIKFIQDKITPVNQLETLPNRAAQDSNDTKEIIVGILFWIIVIICIWNYPIRIKLIVIFLIILTGSIIK